MNTIKLKGLMFLVFPVIFACTSQNVSEVPAFFVTSGQKQQLDVLYYEAERKARKLPRIRAGANSRTRVNGETVATLLRKYDPDIQAVLNTEQWATYDEFLRDDWVREIAGRLGRRRGSATGALSAGSSASVGIWNGSPGGYN